MNTSVTLNKITLREVPLELAEPFETSAGNRTTRRVLLLNVEDTDGATTWSECVAFEDPGYMPETIVSARYVIGRIIAPMVLGRAFEHPSEVSPVLRTAIRGNEMARAAVEMAVWALAAEKSGTSLAAFIGGTRPAVETGLAIGIQPSLNELRKRVGEAIAEGYRRVKLKIAPGRDVDAARAACAAVGPDKVMLDANCAYTLDDLDMFRELDALGLLMIEQPLAWDDIMEHAALQRELATPICLDESLNCPARVQDMVALGSGRIVNLKPGRVGGIAESLAIHDFCMKRGVPIWCGGMLESGIGRAYNVALASLPGFTLPGDLSPSRRYWKQDLVEPEWEMDSDGMVTVPRGPGLGVDVDAGRIDALSENVEVNQAP